VRLNVCGDFCVRLHMVHTHQSACHLLAIEEVVEAHQDGRQEAHRQTNQT
jgi:hypothetical protein